MHRSCCFTSPLYILFFSLYMLYVLDMQSLCIRISHFFVWAANTNLHLTCVRLIKYSVTYKFMLKKRKTTVAVISYLGYMFVVSNWFCFISQGNQHFTSLAISAMLAMMLVSCTMASRPKSPVRPKIEVERRYDAFTSKLISHSLTVCFNLMVFI